MRDKAIKEKNQKLTAELKIKDKELKFFKDITSILTSTLDLNKSLSAIMKKTITLIGAEAWFVLHVNEEKGELFFGKTWKAQSKEMRKFRLKIDEDIAGWVVKEGVSIVVPDASKDGRFNRKIDRLLHIKTRTFMCIPIKLKNRVIGILEVVNKDTRSPFTEEDLDLVNHAAMAIQQAFLYQKMEELTVTDDLTSLFNLRYLNRTIDTEIERSNRYGPPLTLIFMDIDNFKKVNDKHGHLVGGRVLIEIAKILLSNLRTLDIVTRYGGDEFVIVLPQTPTKAGFMVAERIRKAIEQHVFFEAEGYSIRITGSFGVASYPEHAKSKEDLFRLADEAMYRGKKTTKNIVYAAK